MADLSTALIGACAAVTGVYLAQFLGERYKRFRDGSAIASGLQGELLFYAELHSTLDASLKAWLEAIDSYQRGRLNIRAGAASKHQYFSAVVDKLGLLDGEIVRDVIYVYGQLDGFEASMSIIFRDHEQMSDSEMRGRLIQLQETAQLVGARMADLLPRLAERANRKFSFSR